MKIRSDHKYIICGGDQIILNNFNLLNLGNIDKVECLDCGILSRVPFFDNKSIDKYYSSHCFRYLDNIQDQMAFEQPIDLHDSIKIQNIDISKIDVLEIGSGNVFFFKNLEKLSFFEARGCVLFLKRFFLIELKHIFKHSISSSQDLPSISFLFKPI